MVMVLETVGLPPDDITIILAVDWLLDRSDLFIRSQRTTFYLFIPILLGSEQQLTFLVIQLARESSTT